MSIFSRKSKSFNISEIDPTYKVRYLGNVQTAMMKGEGCVDKPVKILWDNYMKNAPTGLEMKLTICAAGLKAQTKPQGLTEYRAHRISYCVAHPKYPKLFVWVYRHEGKKMKVELRCHAVLCKTGDKAKAMAVLLHDKLSLALSEFLREKTRSQNSRLTLQRTNSLPSSLSKPMGYMGMPLRKKMLSTSQNFKPSIDKSTGAPKLVAISEDLEPEITDEAMEDDDNMSSEDIEEDIDDEAIFQKAHEKRHSRNISKDDSELNRLIRESKDVIGEEETMFDVDVEMGNDINELKKDEKVRFHMHHEDSDDSSHDSESGYSEQESRETGSSGSGSWVDSGIETDNMSGDLAECHNSVASTDASNNNNHKELPRLDVIQTCICDPEPQVVNASQSTQITNYVHDLNASISSRLSDSQSKEVSTKVQL